MNLLGILFTASIFIPLLLLSFYLSFSSAENYNFNNDSIWIILSICFFGLGLAILIFIVSIIMGIPFGGLSC